MRKIYLTVLATSFIAFLAFSLFTGCEQKSNARIESEEEEENDEYDGPGHAAEFDIERTKNPITGKVPWQQLRIAVEQTEQAKAAARIESTQALVWSERGPNGDFSRLSGNSRPNDDQTGGRIRAIMVDSLDPTHKTVFAGSVAGGLWRTSDITASPSNWTLVNDFLSNLAIADICQDPRPGFRHIMYLCTGESYFNADAVRGVGVFKSTDAGVSWSFLPSTNAFLNGTKILCDNLGNVYLGTRGSGLRRSTDGGSSWTNITPPGLPADICDLEISSTAVPARLHVVTGIFSTQGYRFTDIPSTVTTGFGWNTPTTPFPSFSNRAEIAVSGNTLYALPANASDQAPTVYKSTDGGDNWATAGSTPLTVSGSPFANGQGWYDLSIRINPANPEECIIGGIDCARTTNGGTTWTRFSVWVGGSGQYVHADQQNILWWDGGTKLMFSSDGGIFFSSDGGATIRDRNKGLRIKQFYSVAIHPTEINNFIAGAQDNGMHRINHPGLDSSIEFYGGDGMYAAIDQDEPQYQFGAAFNNNIRRTTNGGASWGSVGFSGGRFVSPWDYDNTGNIMYICNAAGSYLRWNNPQGGAVSSNIVSVAEFSGGNVSSVHVSPYTANRVFFGTGSGGIIRVDNANVGTNTTGTNITPSGASGYVNCVVTGSSDQNLIACYSSYGVINVWVSANGGATWTASDGNLPDMPVRWALFHPDTDTKAYIATETGIWETDLLSGASTIWNANTSFPNVRTDMIKYRSSDRLIAAGTHGRGIWTTNVAPPSGFTFTNPAPAVSACPATAPMDIVLGTISNGGFTNPITLSASTPPGVTSVSFIPGNVVAPGNSVTVRLSGVNTLAPGSYTITITGTANGAPTQTRDLTFTISAGSGPAITVQPVNQIVCAGSNASFTITSATASSFQWQVSTDGGANYTNVVNGGVYSGATTNTLSLTGVTAVLNNNRYRAIASALCGTSISNAGILNVNTIPVITTQPQDATLCINSNQTFTATVTGNGLTYQWQVSANGCSGPWTNIVGATTSSLTLTGITAGQNNTGYRVVISSSCTAGLTSNCALLTVVTSVGITSQPASLTVCEGSNASFTVAGSGTGIIYQWQVSTDGGANYNNVADGGVYSGATTPTLTITGATFSLNNNRYRAQLSNATCTTPGVSSTAILTVNILPAISAHPQSSTICAGGNTSFSVTASGTGLSYQWQRIPGGQFGGFQNVVDGGVFSGATTATLTLTGAGSGNIGDIYRVIVSGTCSPAVISISALLNVIIPVSINLPGQPVNVEVCSGSNATFNVTGNSTQPVIYQWQISTNGGTTWTNITGANAASYTVASTVVLMNGNRYRVLLSNATCTVPTTSNAAILTVRQLPVVGLTAAPLTSLLPGQTTTLTATPSASTGGVLTTTWYKDAAVFTNTGNTYLADVTQTGSYQVKIQETFTSGLTCFNESPIVIISASVSSKLFIFPSPNDGQFKVSYYNTGGTGTSRMITVFDSKGAKVYGAKFPIVGPYTILSIDLRPAQRGIYYVVVGDALGAKLAEGKVMVNW